MKAASNVKAAGKTMNTGNSYVDLRPSRSVRLVEHAGRVLAYPEPHRTPVLPTGWAPLTSAQQDAVLEACDAAADCLMFRLASLWESGVDYRVYRLTNEEWAGLWVASRWFSQPGEPGCNQQLLGLGSSPTDAVRLAIDFFNWDLEAHGESWRLSVTPTVAYGDPRRV